MVQTWIENSTSLPCECVPGGKQKWGCCLERWSDWIQCLRPQTLLLWLLICRTNWKPTCEVVHASFFAFFFFLPTKANIIHPIWEIYSSCSKKNATNLSLQSGTRSNDLLLTRSQWSSGLKFHLMYFSMPWVCMKDILLEPLKYCLGPQH